MKAYLRRVAISAAALFLLIALVAPVISASDGTNTNGTATYSATDQINQGYSVPIQQVYEYPDDQEPKLEPKLEPEPEPVPQVEPAQETEEISADMPQEDEDPASPAKKNGKGKSIPQAFGFWRNLLRKVQ